MDRLELLDNKCRALPTFAELSVEAIVGAGGMLSGGDNKLNINHVNNGISLFYHCHNNINGENNDDNQNWLLKNNFFAI